MKVYQTANWTPQDPCGVIRRPKGGGEMSVLAWTPLSDFGHLVHAALVARLV